MKRGRPRRFQWCPECGAKEIHVTFTRKAGHCVNVYCECETCGSKLRFVKADGDGYWIRVRTIEK